MTTKKSGNLTLRDRLSRLTFVQASKLLGETGAAMIREGGKLEINLEEVKLTNKRLVAGIAGETVRMWLSDHKRSRLEWSCSGCTTVCAHVGAAFSLILKEKTALGLAAPPTERMLAERQERARTEKMRIKTLTPGVLWSDYALDRLKRQFPLKARNMPYCRKNISVHLRYTGRPELR